MVRWGKKKGGKAPISAGDGKRESMPRSRWPAGTPPLDLVPCCIPSVWDSVTCPRPRVLPADAWERVPTFPRQKPGSAHPPGRSSRAPAGRRSAEGLYLEEKEERW